MNSGYLLHILAAWRLDLSVGVALGGGIGRLCAGVVLGCVTPLDGSQVPAGMQPVEPTPDELCHAIDPRRGLGLPDRLLLTLGGTRRLVCVSDEPALVEAARESGLECLDTPRLLDALASSGHITGPHRAALADALGRTSASGTYRRRFAPPVSASARDGLPLRRHA